MHAYLIVGKNKKLIDSEVDKLLTKINGTSFEFPLNKINEVRELSKFTRLSFDKTTTIIIKNLQDASMEALNAFLKNLEEPNNNINFILTSDSEYNLLPTIISRCQIIYSTQIKNYVDMDNVIKFLNMNIGERFHYLENIKKRDEGLIFIDNIILGLHKLLVSGKKNSDLIASAIKTVQKTHSALKMNGNVSLQLTNMAVNLTI